MVGGMRYRDASIRLSLELAWARHETWEKKSSTSFLSFSPGGAVDLTPTLDPIVRAAVNLASSDPGSYLPYPDALYTSTELGKISAK